MNPFSFLHSNLSEIDRDTSRIIEFEERRQERKIILIASESICPQAVLQAQASVFSHIYAEGYPSWRMSRTEREEILDFERFLSLHRRLGDRRHYKGCDYTNFIEALAQWRVARLFAHDDGNICVKPQDIFVNVQPLSGAAANNAVYMAFVTPGETVLGMALPHGGHLTHGSPFNRSGKFHRGIGYEIDPATGKIDYDEMRKLAVKHRPKLIIGGASAYPWDFDWRRMRQIADEVGAILLADIAHPSGLVAAGLFPNPVGYAHVTSMTTHKTLCGPRAAILITTDQQLAKRIDTAVFPGEQGGPHIHTIAALAVTFQIAATPEFKELMKQVVDNASSLAKSLAARGLKIAYGGTNTHMCLVDLREVKTASGLPLKGDIASHVLDLCGITCNKNTIIGDVTAADSSAIRLGTTWVSQLGMGPGEMDKIAELIHRTLVHIRSFSFLRMGKTKYRGKIPHEVMLDIRREVASLTGRGEHPVYPQHPHYHAPFTAVSRESLLHWQGAKTVVRGGVTLLGAVENADSEWRAAKEGCVLIHHSECGILEIVGEKAQLFVADLVPADVYALEEGSGLRTLLLDREGKWIDDVHLFRLPAEEQKPRFWLIVNPHRREYVKEWLSDVSDGYVVIDEKAPRIKLLGPVVARDLFDRVPAMTVLVLAGPKTPEVLAKISPSLAGLSRFQMCRIKCGAVDIAVAHTGYREQQCIYEIYLPLEDAPEVMAKLNEIARGLFKQGGQEVLDNLRREANLPVEKEEGDLASLQRKFPGYFMPAKPYGIGGSVAVPAQRPGKVTYAYAKYEGEPRFTPLAGEHKKLSKRPLVPFAGWMMPIVYASILEEHRAVREAAGLFDVTHMGTLEISGKGADRFLNLVATNEASKLKIGQSHYSYLLSPQGRVVDDIMVYRRGKDRFMLVVNAVNAEKDIAWLQAIASREFVIDMEFPYREIDVVPEIRNLHIPEAKGEGKVDIALQGPKSLDILLSAAGNDSELKAKLAKLPRFHFLETELSGIPMMISRSGYTGEEWGYEIYLHPDDAVTLWGMLLDRGKPYGLKPTGLGARDSTRTESGFPLHGHELEGPWDVTPLEAGYSAFVKYYKPFFIGKKALLQKDTESRHRIVRFEIRESGTRAVRHGAVVVNRRGQVIGNVTSCTYVGESQIGMAYVDHRHAEEGTQLGILIGEKVSQKAISELKQGDSVPAYITAVVISRFVMKPAPPK